MRSILPITLTFLNLIVYGIRAWGEMDSYVHYRWTVTLFTGQLDNINQNVNCTGEWGVFNGYRVSVGEDENVLEMVVTAIQQCART